MVRQERVSKQVAAEQPKKKSKPQAVKGAVQKVADTVKGALEEKTVDPVEAALAKYSIITENPWEKGVK